MIQADASKKKADKTMAEFLANIKSQKADWEENLTYRNESGENIEVSDEDDQFSIFSDKKFEKEKNEKEK